MDYWLLVAFVAGFFMGMGVEALIVAQMLRRA